MSYTLTAISDFPHATLPLSGNELVIINQDDELVIATVQEINNRDVLQLQAHLDDLSNPHEVAFSQLIDVQLESIIVDGDLIQFDGNNQNWKNIRKENVTDGGNF